MDIALKGTERHTVTTAISARRPRRELVLVTVHVLLWAVFLSLPAIFNPRRDSMDLANFVADLAEPARWTNGLLLIGVFYFNYYVAIPILYVRRQYVVLAAFFIFWFCSFLLINWVLTPPDLPHPGRFLFPGNSFDLFMFLIANVASYALCLYELWQKMKDEKLNTEIRFLKSQVNPHFLFNTLNSIYALSVTQPDKAPDAIIKLSGLMRYTVNETNEDHVSLSKEVEYITNYIELQKLRLSDKVNISYEINGQPNGQLVAPFLLVPFVENAFKFGVNAEERSDIQIKLNIGHDELHLTVANRKVYIRPEIHHTSTGLGINTTRKRLQQMYAGRHTLQIGDNGNEFAVSLFIKLK